MQSQRNRYVESQAIQILHNRYFEGRLVQSQRNRCAESQAIQILHNRYFEGRLVQSQRNRFVESQAVQILHNRYIEGRLVQSQRNRCAERQTVLLHRNRCERTVMPWPKAVRRQLVGGRITTVITTGLAGGFHKPYKGMVQASASKAH